MMQANFSYWHYPTEITVGVGARSKVISDAHSIGLNNPMVVCDHALPAIEIFNQLLAQLKESHPNIAIFTDFASNPTLSCVNKGIALCQSQEHDGVIAIGGGSALDVGKAIAFMAYQKGTLIDYEDIGDQWQNANTKCILPSIAIPTTAGTGSEVGRVSVISDDEANKKRLIFHPDILPKRVILDPELTIDLPLSITAATGMDALAHNMESYFSPEFHPLANGIAIEGMKMIHQHLPMVINDPHNLESRQAMMVASLMGAAAFQKGLGAMHALAHPLGARFNSHHGLLNAVLMPYVLQANRPSIQVAAGELARQLNIGSDFNALMQWVLELRQHCKIPHALHEIGVHDAAADWIAEQAILDPSAATNPIPFSKEQYRIILMSAIHGELK